jgi:hypothetical protein
MSYIGNDEWLLVYNNIEFGIFKSNFVKDKQVKSVTIKMNEFVEMDAYEFTKI